MTSICFVCNLPIMSHQVGLVWQGGNGWDEMVREQVIFLQYLIDIARSEHGRARFGETRHFFCKLKRKRKTIYNVNGKQSLFFSLESRIASHRIELHFHFSMQNVSDVSLSSDTYYFIFKSDKCLVSLLVLR